MSAKPPFDVPPQSAHDFLYVRPNREKKPGNTRAVTTKLPEWQVDLIGDDLARRTDPACTNQSAWVRDAVDLKLFLQKYAGEPHIGPGNISWAERAKKHKEAQDGYLDDMNELCLDVSMPPDPEKAERLTMELTAFIDKEDLSVRQHRMADIVLTKLSYVTNKEAT